MIRNAYDPFGNKWREKRGKIFEKRKTKKNLTVLAANFKKAGVQNL